MIPTKKWMLTYLLRSRVSRPVEAIETFTDWNELCEFADEVANDDPDDLIEVLEIRREGKSLEAIDITDTMLAGARYEQVHARMQAAHVRSYARPA